MFFIFVRDIDTDVQAMPRYIKVLCRFFSRGSCVCVCFVCVVCLVILWFFEGARVLFLLLFLCDRVNDYIFCGVGARFVSLP